MGENDSCVKEFLKLITVQNLFSPQATCFEGSECLSALAASSLAISLTLGDNQATRYIASKASRATIRPFVKRPCPILLGGKKNLWLRPVEFSSVPSPPAFAHILYILFAYISTLASSCVPIVHVITQQCFSAPRIPLPLALSDRFPSFHLCVCLSIFLCGWFSPVMGLGRLCSSHCCNVHVLQISPSSGGKKTKKLYRLTEDTGRCSPRSELSVSSPPSAALLFLASFKVWTDWWS